jgi:hypothetical protein
MDYPNHYPAQCPPVTSTDVRGEIYRFVKGPEPVASDFISHYVMFPARYSSDEACQACGLSVSITEADAREAQKLVPSLKKKKVAKARLSGEWGKIAKTPSKLQIPNHHTWWVPNGKTPEALFSVVVFL